MPPPPTSTSEAPTTDSAVGESATDGGYSSPVELRRSPVRRTSGRGVAAPAAIFGPSFYLAFVANLLALTAGTLMYRFGDFVTFLGGTELELGQIVGVGMIGSLVMRLLQGAGIDRYGPREIWLASLAMMSLSFAGHLFVVHPNHVEIFLLQALYRVSLAGVLGASFSYVSYRLPVEGMATAIGTLGLAGMTAMLIGPLLGDFITGASGSHVPVRAELDRMFLTGAVLAALAMFAAWGATRGLLRPEKRRHIPMLAILRLYHPGSLLFVGVITGLAIGMPATFLRTFAAELHIAQIAPFFAVYAIVALVVRIGTRRLSEQIGIRPMIIGGLASFAAASIAYLPVTAPWQLAFPAVFTGIAHAALFPAVVAGGSATFPPRYRGLGTTLALGMMDVGTMIGAPLAGGLVHGARLAGLPGYPTMFIVTASLIGLTALGYMVIGPASVVSTRSADG